MSPLPPDSSRENQASGFSLGPRQAWLPERGDDLATEPARIVCWRCEKSVRLRLGRCPFCRARLGSVPEERIILRQRLSPLFKVVGLLVAVMIVSLTMFLILRGRYSPWMPWTEWQELRLQAMLIAEGVTTALVVLGFCWIGLLPGPARPAWNWRLVAWIWAVPGLAVLIGMNVGYAWLLRQYLPPLFRDEWPVTPLVILVLCVQPAVVEEFFFRYLALNALRQHMGLHGAVWVSSVMFGLSHIGNPFAIPYLVMLGVGLGYARLASGGLALPMLMHGLHNFVVIYLQNVL